MEIFGFIFFGGMLWLGLALFFHSFERSREGGMLFSAFLSIVGIWALRLIFKQIRSRPYFRDFLKKNEEEYRKKVLANRDQ